MTRDEALQTLIDTTVLEHTPPSPLAADVERARWSRDHPRPAQGSKPEDAATFRTLQTAWQADYQKRWSDEPGVITDRFIALSSTAAALSLDERLSIVDRYLALQATVPGLLVGDDTRARARSHVLRALGHAIGPGPSDDPGWPEGSGGREHVSA